MLWWIFAKLSCLFSNHWSVFLQNLLNSSVSCKITHLYLCSSNNIFFGHKDPIKTFFFFFFFDFWSAQIKISQISYVNFETTSQFLSNFCILLQFQERLLLCTFLAQTIYTLLERNPLKWKFSRLFEYSGQNLSNFLCQFWNNKSIPLQFLHPSSVSGKITPLHFFSSNNIYFARKEPIKMKIFETFRVLRSKFVKLLMPIFKRQVHSSPNFAPLFRFVKDYPSVLF